MRDPKRIERILSLIREIWYAMPDQRLTQLIMNSLLMKSDPYYVEDDFLEKKLREHKQKFVE
jgi:hypothetical protein